MTFEEFATAAEIAGLVARRCAAWHWQLLGGTRPVNYYPQTGTIYVNGQERATQHGDGHDAIRVALRGPRPAPGVGHRVKLGGRKRRLFRTTKTCRWCGAKLTLATATVEHLVPLMRGGSNRDDNLALACAACNHERGNAWSGPRRG